MMQQMAGVLIPSTSTINGGGQDPRKPEGGMPRKYHYTTGMTKHEKKLFRRAVKKREKKAASGGTPTKSLLPATWQTSSPISEEGEDREGGEDREESDFKSLGHLGKATSLNSNRS